MGEGEPRLRALEEPDALRRVDHRVDDRKGGDRPERAPARGRRHLQPAARPHAARDRRDHPLRTRRPADPAADRRRPAQPDALQHAALPGSAADPDLQPGPAVDPGCGPSGERRLPLLRAQAGQASPLLHEQLRRVPGLRRGTRLYAVISGTTKLVGLIGDPVAESLSPRMQNAAFAARGLDWAYVPLEAGPDGLEKAIAGLVALGFAGANVTIPYKTRVLAFCDELDPVATRAGSGHLLVVREGRRLGASPDRQAGTAA